MAISDLDSILCRIISFQRLTFGNSYREQGLTAHIRKELGEIAEADLEVTSEEWIDVIFLAIHGWWASHQVAFGGEDRIAADDLTESLRYMLRDKLVENEGRDWQFDRNAGDIAIEHVRD